MALVSESDLEARIGRSLTADESNAFTIINAAIQSYIERVIIGSSVESASESSRYFDGGFQHLPIDPCTNVTSVKIVDDDQTVTDTVDTTDYVVEPFNETLKTMIRYRAGKLPTGINNILVTAKFSIYADTDILNIVKDAILSSLESEISNSSNKSKESIEGYSVEYATSQTKDALRKLRSIFPL